jgi:pilus assembly protein CpaE
MARISFIIVSHGRKFDAALEASGDVEICARVENLDDLVQTVGQRCPDALLVSLEHDPQAMFDALEKLLAPKPLLFFHGPADSRLILQAMRSGAYEYIAPAADEEAQLVAAIRRSARETNLSTQARQAPLIALMGAKGGVGTSFVACQLGASLAREGCRTALVDGHQRHGDVALYLDLSPPYTFASLATRSEPVDATYLQTAMVSHTSGVAVLAAPKAPEEAEAVTPSCVEEVIGLLRAEFEWVIWDTPHDFDDRSLVVLDQADSILLITTPDVPAMSHTRMQLELLERLGHGEQEVRIVLNRTQSRASVSARDAKEFLERPIAAGIPNDFRRASVCVDEGRSLHEMAPRSPLAQSVGELVRLTHSWCNRSNPTRPRRGLLDRLRGR